MGFDEAKWFDFGDGGRISFLIRPMNPKKILDSAEKRRMGEFDDEGMRKELFCSVFVTSVGVENCGAFSREEQLGALFNDQEIQNFVLMKSAELLEQKALELEKAHTFLEQTFLKSGRLKS